MRTIILASAISLMIGGASAEPAVSYEEVIERALITARGVVDEELRDASLASIVKDLAESERLAEAVGTANEIESSGVRGHALRVVVQVHLDEDDDDGALAVAKGIEDVAARDWALRDIAEWQAGEGEVERALTTLELIATAAEQAIALGDIAEETAKRGDEAEARAHLAHALELANTVDAAATRALTLVELAKAHDAMDGPDRMKQIFDLALAAAMEVDNPVARDRAILLTGKGRVSYDSEGVYDHLEALSSPAWRVLLLRELGKGYSSVDRPQDARQALEAAVEEARKIEEGAARARLLGKVAEFFIEAVDDLDRALELVELADDSEGRDVILMEVIGALGEEHQMEVALEIADLMSSTRFRVLALLETARSLADSGDPAGAAAVTAQAWSLAEETPLSALQPFTQRKFAEAYAKAGDLERAVETAASIEPLHYRAMAYRGVADVLSGRRGPPHKQ
jgi:tetratricopeptide (TPR) repeat protein